MQHGDVAALRPRHISQGEYVTGSADGRSITTILGSCVATCLYDAQCGIGGMNHFLLPENTGSAIQSASFGVNAMELLINELIKQGARRTALCAKVFGGARMMEGLSDIGAKNAAFVLEFLERENIECTGQSLGGTQARRVEFWPSTGRARQKFLGDARLSEFAVAPTPASQIELF